MDRPTCPRQGQSLHRDARGRPSTGHDPVEDVPRHGAHGDRSVGKGFEVTNQPDPAVDAALTAPYHRIFVKQADGGYWARVLELEGIHGAGDTIEEANETLEYALTDWVEIELERGHDIPA